METRQDRASQYRAEAERLRRNAETVQYSETRKLLLTAATMYDQLAEMIERIPGLIP